MLDVKWVKGQQGQIYGAEFPDALGDMARIEYQGGGEICIDSMWLDRDQARSLAAILLRFADTGELGEESST